MTLMYFAFPLKKKYAILRYEAYNFLYIYIIFSLGAVNDYMRHITEKYDVDGMCSEINNSKKIKNEFPVLALIKPIILTLCR